MMNNWTEVKEYFKPSRINRKVFIQSYNNNANVFLFDRLLSLLVCLEEANNSWSGIFILEEDETSTFLKEQLTYFNRALDGTYFSYNEKTGNYLTNPDLIRTFILHGNFSEWLTLQEDLFIGLLGKSPRQKSNLLLNSFYATVFGGHRKVLEDRKNKSDIKFYFAEPKLSPLVDEPFLGSYVASTDPITKDSEIQLIKKHFNFTTKISAMIGEDPLIEFPEDISSDFKMRDTVHIDITLTKLEDGDKDSGVS